VTDGSGELLAHLLYKQQAQQYVDVELSYYSSHSGATNGGTKAFPMSEDWAGQYGPSGNNLRELYDLASSSLLSDTGVSNYDRHCQEIQSAVCDTSISVNHTFQALKNYPLSIRDKMEALFGISVKTGKVACAVVVRSTAIKEVAHAVEQFIRRKNINPKVILTDTWPSNTESFGSSCLATPLSANLACGILSTGFIGSSMRIIRILARLLPCFKLPFIELMMSMKEQ
jgi:hypothetical protein